MNEINGYTLNTKINTYPTSSVCEFGNSSYQLYKTWGICRQFKKEKFYHPENNILFGKKCPESIIATIDEIIYKISFTAHLTDPLEYISFRDQFFDKYLISLGNNYTKEVIGNSNFIIYDTRFGNAVIQTDGYSITIILTSSLIKTASPLSFWDRLIMKWFFKK